MWSLQFLRTPACSHSHHVIWLGLGAKYTISQHVLSYNTHSVILMAVRHIMSHDLVYTTVFVGLIKDISFVILMLYIHIRVILIQTLEFVLISWSHTFRPLAWIVPVQVSILHCFYLRLFIVSKWPIGISHVFLFLKLSCKHLIQLLLLNSFDLQP